MWISNAYPDKVLAVLQHFTRWPAKVIKQGVKCYIENNYAYAQFKDTHRIGFYCVDSKEIEVKYEVFNDSSLTWVLDEENINEKDYWYNRSCRLTYVDWISKQYAKVISADEVNYDKLHLIWDKLNIPKEVRDRFEVDSKELNRIIITNKFKGKRYKLQGRRNSPSMIELNIYEYDEDRARKMELEKQQNQHRMYYDNPYKYISDKRYFKLANFIKFFETHLLSDQL